MIPKRINGDVARHQDEITTALCDIAHGFELHTSEGFPLETLIIGENWSMYALIISSTNYASFQSLPLAQKLGPNRIANLHASLASNHAYGCISGGDFKYENVPSLDAMLRGYQRVHLPLRKEFGLLPIGRNREKQAQKLGQKLKSGELWQDIAYQDRVIRIITGDFSGYIGSSMPIIVPPDIDCN